MKTIWFYDWVYKRNILFVIGEFNKCAKFVKKRYGVELKDNGSFATTYDVNDYGIIIWLSKFDKGAEKMAVLSHEIYHAMEFVMDRIHFIGSADDNEPKAYYIEWMTRTFLEKYK